MTIRSGTRDSQIQDDEDVDVLRSSDCHWNMPSPFSPISPLAQFGPIFPTWPNFPAFGPISLILLPHIRLGPALINSSISEKVIFGHFKYAVDLDG